MTGSVRWTWFRCEFYANWVRIFKKVFDLKFLKFDIDRVARIVISRLASQAFKYMKSKVFYVSQESNIQPIKLDGLGVFRHKQPW